MSMKCKYIITRHHKHHDSLHDDEKEIKLDNVHAYEHVQKAMGTIKGYKDYVKKHGFHFTDNLAKHACDMMINVDGSSHSMTTDLVKIRMANSGLSVPSNVTLGDVTYLTNMYYADFYPNPLTDETQCVRAAYNIATDPDGYDGMIFRRWVSDIVGKKIEIDWEHFI